MTLFQFKSTSNLSNWTIIGDYVMGGVSNGNFYLSESGTGVFKGEVSLDNNGGFSMVKYSFATKQVDDFTSVSIRLKGDGKRYQFRVKTNESDSHSYVAYFNTSGDWETIEIPFSNLSPTFRGRPLNMENYPGQHMEQIAFLIGNKKAESFQLEIDRIELI
ncbi:NADH:ubiquinone oxidoreductase [Yeosuana aromativorans]|uniref:NADH:ubiquinone oxidoreductase n=1 Tax=Yeosuana aromativorans TaxID=288019 RepID=A0A8J3FGL8_9FLAO|nr:CIA30 family protein [Yeosuana aromativorans]GGK25498.1 NADH:ubiquinone oxidoreductase [Yeosuana aromativorans]